MKHYEDIKKELEKSLKNYEAMRDAWQAVTYNTTKSGDAFKTLSKNFNNCRVCSEEFSLKSGDKKIKVSGRTAGGEWFADDIRLSCTDISGVDPSRVIKETCLTPYYFMNVEEIKAAINARIALYNNYIETKKKELEALDTCFNMIDSKCQELHKLLNMVSNKGANASMLSLRYALEDYIKNYYFN